MLSKSAAVGIKKPKRNPPIYTPLQPHFPPRRTPSSKSRTASQSRQSDGTVLPMCKHPELYGPPWAIHHEHSTTSRHIQARPRTANYAQFASNAINPTPRTTQAYAESCIPRPAFRISGLNMNSCATSSTSAVYMRMPPLMASNTPLTTLLVAASRASDLLATRPIPMAMGVLMA